MDTGARSATAAGIQLHKSLLHELGKCNPVITISRVEGERLVYRIVDMCVDGKYMWTAYRSLENDPNEISTLVDEFRRATQAWECLLFASGGLLVLHTCYWWWVTWRWGKGIPIIVDGEDVPDNLSRTNGTTQWQNNPATQTK